LSRLCGLYSLLNGILLALYPRELRRDELQALYLEAIRELSRRRQLRGVLGVGMGEALWLSLGEHLIHHLNGRQGSNMKLAHAINGAARQDRGRALRAIRTRVAGSSPVLTLLGGTLDHYTTICGYTASRFLFFDSSGLHWVQAEHIGLGPRSRRRHWINPHSTVFIADEC
jgi:hypothetical protein